jgi:hypothetical protein
VHINETVQLGEMEPQQIDGQPCHTWPCRCGGAYYLLDDDVDAAGTAELAGGAEVAVPCSTCSLHIRVLLNASE